jgi:hypothetical protein
VATRHHTIEVIGDNLPLPWALASQAPVGVDVKTRSRTLLDVASIRMR